MQNKLSPFILLITLCFLLLGKGICLAENNTLYFGLPPFANSATMQRNFEPLAKYLSQKLEQPVELTFSPNYITHIMNLAQGRIDIGYVGPSPYVKIHDRYKNIELLAKLKMKESINDQVVIVTRDDNDIKNLQDIVGKTFVFGDHHSYGSHFMPRYLLFNNGVPLKNLAAYDYVGSHDNVILSVEHGDFDAGGIRFDIFQKYNDRSLRIIHGPSAIPPHVLVCRSSLPDILKEKLRLTLLSVTNPKVFKTINPAMLGFSPVTDEEFGQARKVIDFIESR